MRRMSVSIGIVGCTLAALCFVGTTTNAFVVLPSSARAVPPSSTRLHYITPPSSSYQALVEKLPSQNVIQVVEQSPDGKVIAADVATQAGVSLSQARKDLTALASLSQADIAVSSDGELIFDFPTNINSVLSQNSAKFKAQQVFRTIWPGLFYVLRVSFGVVLLASLAAIFSTLLFLQSSSSSSSDDDRRQNDNRGMSFGGSYFWGPSPFDFFYYRPYYGYYGPMKRDPEEMGFLESVFSYIFGDGNPNEGLEEKRLSLAANMIRANGGSVTAEQLAPYCDDVPRPSNDKKESAYVDESFVLPIVTQLNGEPQVTDDGDIIYTFPELQISTTSSSTRKSLQAVSTEESTLKRAGLRKDASAREIASLLQLNGISTRGALERKDLVKLLEKALPPLTREERAELELDDPTMLQEREYEFSLANPFNRFLAGGLGIVNLLGALYLGNMLSSPALYGVQLPSYFGLVQAGFPLLLTYAVLFNVIPLVRSFYIKGENEKIRRRNKTRRLWKEMLDDNVFAQLGRKLKAAKQMKTKMKRLGASGDEVIYDTKQSTQEIEKVKQQNALDEFDKLLEKEEKSFE